MMIFDSASPMRIVLSFLLASQEKLLTHHLGSDRQKTLNDGKRKRERAKLETELKPIKTYKTIII